MTGFFYVVVSTPNRLRKYIVFVLQNNLQKSNNYDVKFVNKS